MNQEKSSLPAGTHQELNWERIEKFVRCHIADLSNESLQIKQYSAGYSNLTYSIKIGDWEAVVRRPPFGTIPPRAHDMEREYRILQKIHHVFPLAPQPYLYCDDRTIMDKHFFVMEKKNGIVIDDKMPSVYEESENTGKIISETVVNTLVQLHSIDYENAGLSDIGNPEGYLERQVFGWIKRYHNAKTDDIDNVDDIEKWLISNIPTNSPRPTILHNDYKLNNMMLSVSDPSVPVAVFDWELCTIGDPLTDLGSTLAYWMEYGEAETGLSSITTNPGFIKRRDFVQLYAMKSGRDLANINYYLTFAFYKIGVILQQIYYRWKQGQSTDNRFSRLNAGIRNLMQQAVQAKNKKLL